MSKAFTRESDDLPEPSPARRMAAAPGDERRHLTPTGARVFREDLARLEAALDGGSGMAEERARAEQLRRILAVAVVVALPEGPPDEVRFGATVTVRGKSGETMRCRLVGPGEVDLDRDWVNWRSPLGRALVGARKGQRVHVRLPAGPDVLEIEAVTYE